ncbi:tetratricopeptide repeat protein [Chryseolinea sp. H1M3-3]|uniref:tetratricopeptide repeat protein n=1 Tax=Chryseolinea sp. H1M3-3 TaxID=3034144 RepID=UPI0023EAEF2F|nr:tetratricopeptide repeat protein [Chryseolinea sp. H1M3-3]
MKTTPLFLTRFILFAVIVSFTLNNSVVAQNHKIDSLKLKLDSSVGGQRCDVLIDLSIAYFGEGISLTAFDYANEALQIAQATADTLKLVKTVRLKARIFRTLNQIDSSLILLHDILPIAKKKRYFDEIGFILNGLGISYNLQAHYDLALKYYFEMLEYPAGSGGITEEVRLLNIGFVYYKLKEYRKALEYLDDALWVTKKDKRFTFYEQLLINISLCNAQIGHTAEARKYLREVEERCEILCSKETELSYQYAMGVCSMKEESLFTAKQHFLISYSLAKETNSERLKLDNIILLSEICIRQNSWNEAEFYLGDAENIISEGSPYNRELIKVYSQLISLYSKSNNTEKMTLYQQKYIQLKDSIYSEQLTTNLMRIHADHLEKENKARIESQNKILALNEGVIHQQKIANVSIGGVAVLLVLLTILLAKNNHQRRKMNALLDKKVKERTRELEMNQDNLQRAWDERDVLIKKASEGIQSSIATIRGLSSLGEREIDHPKASEYWSELNITSIRLASILKKINCSSRHDVTV